MPAGLANRFGLLGALIGKFPLCSAVCSVLLVLPSLVALVLRAHLQIGLDAGFVAENAPSRREITVQKQFFGNSEDAKEWYMALFGIARQPNGNMLRSDHFEEFSAFYERVTRHTVLTGPRGNFTYAQICHPLCEINEQLQKLMDYSWMSMLDQVRMEYPVSRVLSYDVNIGKHVFNRTEDANGRLIGAQYVAFYFTSFIREPEREAELALFEQAVASAAAEHNRKSGQLVELLAHGSNIVRAEMSRGVLDAARNRLAGLGLALVAFLCTHLVSAWLFAQSPLRRLLLAFLCLLVPAVSLLASLGAICPFGASVNLLHFTSPLCLVAILSIAQGSFQLGDAWCRLLSESQRKQFSASERLASTFEQIAPSFLCAHLLPILAFGVLSPVLPAEHYRSLAVTLCLLHAHSLLLQLLLFAPLLSLLCHHHLSERVRFSNGLPAVLEFGPNDPTLKKPSIADRPPIVKLKKNGRELIPSASANGHLRSAKKEQKLRALKRRIRLAFVRQMIYPLSTFLNSALGRCLVLLVTVGLCSLSLHRGIPALRNSMDYRRLLPHDSPAQRGFGLVDSIWMDFLQILYIVRRPPDFEDPVAFAQFKEFLSAASSLPQAAPPRAHMSWLFDYYRDQLHSDLFANLSAEHAHERVNMTKFDGFINGFPYSAWKSALHYMMEPIDGTNRSRPSIEQMLLLMAYNGTQGLTGKRTLVRQCRAIAQRFPQFLISVFDTDSRTVDIMDAVDPLVWRSAVVLAASVFVVAVGVLWSLSCSLLSGLSAAALLINFFGIGHFVGLQLDLLTAPTAILVAAQSVQLSSHFAGDFLSCWAREDRSKRALTLSFVSVAKCVSIWLASALPPLLLSQVDFFALQARISLLGAVLAFWHGVFVLPTLVGLVLGGRSN